MSINVNFCQKCGKQVVNGDMFCRYCGYRFATAQQPQVQQVPQMQQMPPMQQMPQMQQYPQVPQAPGARQRRSKKPLVITITAIVLAGSLAVTGFWYPGFLKNIFSGGMVDNEPAITMVKSTEASAKIPADTNGKGTTVGTVAENGYSIHVEDGTFSQGGTLTVTPFDEQKLSKIENKSAYEFLSTPVEVSCDTYSGGFFTEDVIYTVPLPKEADDLGRYVFGYFEEKTGEVRYLQPDSYDLENGTMSVALPHFSSIFGAKLTPEEEKELFLDKFSMQLALDEAKDERMAAELEPYVQAKIKALNLQEQATADLVQAVMNYLSGGYQDEEGVGHAIDTAGKASTTMLRAIYDKDKEAMISGMEDVLNGALMHCWEELQFNDRIDQVLGSEFAGTAVGTLLSSSNGIARMAGRLVEGDYEGAAEELGGVMQGINPMVELGTKGARVLGAYINTGMTYWKSNKLDEMYHIYKNGMDDLFGNYVLPGDKETFLEYFDNQSSGFSFYRDVSRFYNLDKIGEICERYGWDAKTYDELSESQKNEFNKRARDQLMEYFELRAKQEKRADEIKKLERQNIETMLSVPNGVLRSGNYASLFGEESYSDYSLTARLERVASIRKHISQYIDLEKLEKEYNDDPEYDFNMGRLVNEWVYDCSNYTKEEAIEIFCKDLKDWGLLKSGMDAYGEVSLDELEGIYKGTVTAKAIRVTDELYNLYKMMESSGEGIAEGLEEFGVDEYSDLDTSFASKAECDAALAQYIGQVNVDQEIHITQMKKNDFTVTGWIIADETIRMSAPAVFKDEKLILTTEEGNTEINVTKKYGVITLESSKAVLLSSYEQEGMNISYLVEISLKVTKQ